MSNNLTQWYDKAISAEEFRQRFTKLKDGFEHIYDNFSIKEDEDKETLKNKNFKVLVIAEPWCPHCMLNYAILLRMSEAYDFEVRVSPRDENMDLMAKYQTNGKDRIPKFVILDENNNELANWGAMAPVVKEYIDEESKHLPPKDSEEYDEKFKVFAKKVTDRLIEDESIWIGVFEDIKKTLLEV